eukprot:TRINITY_DN10559_c0_g1_i1.p1 TRINITY_DN10559_c0_g1~~TRINITY_DN10559_c0_g1_i1.p1  ORF type:complete len:536 (-),score=141.32 TRINITY_DN10559_c0_g1_i1:39-1610(-)
MEDQPMEKVEVKQEDQKKKKGSSPQKSAASVFWCDRRDASPFKAKEDPFNPQNKLEGFICKKDGHMGGSLYITHVNGKLLEEPQVIYGAPKLLYPYVGFDTDKYMDFTSKNPKSYAISNKWNGTNVHFFRYTDAHGQQFVSAKSKGSVFMGNTPFGAFLTNTRKVVGLDAKDSISLDNLPPLLSVFSDSNIQGVTFELCGKGEPHLVNYDFDLDLKPLFLTTITGQIKPVIVEPDQPFPFTTNEEMVSRCAKFQEQDYKSNVQYRKDHGMEARYEYDHFFMEGRVLYILDAEGFLIRRDMFKIKPRDIEEVHWGNFTSNIQGRVREAIEKIILRNKPMNKASLQEELDMGSKEWSKHGEASWSYALQLTKGEIPSRITDTRRYVILCGFPGSGREVARQALGDRGWTIIPSQISQEDAINLIRSELTKNCKVCIDHFNLEYRERKMWIAEAMKMGVLSIDCIFFDVPKDVCQSNDNGSASKEIWKFRIAKPELREGMGRIFTVKSVEDIPTTLELVENRNGAE